MMASNSYYRVIRIASETTPIRPPDPSEVFTFTPKHSVSLPVKHVNEIYEWVRTNIDDGFLFGHDWARNPIVHFRTDRGYSHFFVEMV